MNISDKVKKIIATVAPTLGTALGGPLGGMAGAFIADALGVPRGDDKAIEAAVTSGNPDILLKLKQADNDFKTRMRELDISEEKLAYDDTANARNREIQVKDHTNAVLAYIITIGFFGTLAFMLVHGKPETGGDALLVMLGALGSAWTAVMAYYYGSSAGSRKNQDALAEIAKS
jgi:hypothetical protein